VRHRPGGFLLSPGRDFDLELSIRGRLLIFLKKLLCRVLLLVVPITTVALVSPTGFRKRDNFYGAPGSSRGLPLLTNVYEFPLWSRPFFDLLNSRASQRYFLAKTFGSQEAIDQGLLEYDYLTAHQPGAQHAPYCFISAIPFSADISRIYDTLELPVWLAHGVRGDFTDYTGTQKYVTRPNWQLRVFQTGGMPYFEQPDEFFTAYDGFVERAGALR